MAYWDTSALLKLYLTEADSWHFRFMAARTITIRTAFIGHHEARTTFRRREAEKFIAAGEASAHYAHLVTDIETGLLELVLDTPSLQFEFGQVLDICMSQSPPVYIRTNDALHLAAAKIAGETEFVSADIKQRAAATLLGFRVMPAVFPIPSQPN